MSNQKKQKRLQTQAQLAGGQYRVVSLEKRVSGVYAVDPCPDANGFWTIRPNDGTEHGDTEMNPVATVYSATPETAKLFAAAPRLLDAAIKARAILGDLIRAGNHSQEEDEAYIELQEVLGALGE